jgi:hypothetical protein
MDLGDYTMVKEQGKRNKEQGTRNEEHRTWNKEQIVLGLDTNNSDL